MLSDRVDAASESASRAMQMVTLIIREIGTELSFKQDKLVSGNNIKTINGESVLGGGDLRVGVSSVESVEALESLEAKAGEIATIARKIGPQAVKVADCYVTNSTDNYASEWDKFTVIKKIEETDVNPESSNVLYICALNESFTKDAIGVGHDNGVRWYARIVDGVESPVSLDIVNDLLATGNYRLVIWAIAGRFDSYFTFYTEVAKDVSDAYIKGETWTRLLKEGDVTGGAPSGPLMAWMPIDMELTKEQIAENAIVHAKIANGYSGTVILNKRVDIGDGVVATSSILPYLMAGAEVEGEYVVAFILYESNGGGEFILHADGTVEILLDEQQ